MNAYIKGIAVFNKDGEKRFVELKRGLNIITGQSKSGKSALLEIIDYCLGNAKYIIPKGEITKFSHLYVILIKIGNFHLALGRESFKGNGRNKMYVYRTSKEVSIKQLKLRHFHEKGLVSLKDAKDEISLAFGLNLSDMTIDSEGKKEGKPSIRSMTSYLFQHQNLIANKFALFYRFDEYKKRESAIKQFPVFAGWVEQKYYSLLYRLDVLEKDKRRLKREKKNYNDAIEHLKRRLHTSFQEYYALIGKSFNGEHSIEYLLEHKKLLPTSDIDSYTSNEIENEYHKLKKIIEDKRNQRHEIDIKIKSLQQSQEYGDDYYKGLKGLENKSQYSNPTCTSYKCPICNQGVDEINSKAKAVIESGKWLQHEINNVKGQNSQFEEEENLLLKQKDELVKEIQFLYRNLRELENMNEELKNKKNMNEKIAYAKAKIDIECQLVQHQRESTDLNGEETLEDEIRSLIEQIEGYNLNKYFSYAENKLSEYMNRIIKGLDFEEEFKPANLNFDLESFELYHYDKMARDKVFLSEMGSGANWLSCHISLFLSLLHFFCKEKNSKIPSFLFFDQPSQVYFPDKVYVDKNDSKGTDIEVVEAMYVTILKELELIYKEAGFMPQIIITDHVDNLNLGNYDFEDYVAARWRDEKFI
ncbi:DUF3732 domain-containing protein [Bacillus cereus]|uniref:DUF3732 domain-containing protein n=2 Tax=Bacteria TaxID=2 RepID=UPI003A8D96B1